MARKVDQSMQTPLYRAVTLALAGSLLLLSAGHAQAPATPSAASAAIDLYSPQKLQQRAVALQAQAEASPSGAASETLEKYPQHFTMLAYRNKSGGAEVHARFADVFLIETGSATLETGGTVVAPKVDDATGETRGSALENSRVQQLHAGDIVHIPAGVPHRMRLEPGATLLYFVVKVQESGAP
jgi:mannose-6-phosphate isomerase-like protein (cupin superfamily)